MTGALDVDDDAAADVHDRRKRRMKEEEERKEMRRRGGNRCQILDIGSAPIRPRSSFSSRA